MAVTRKRVLWVDDEIEFLRSHIMFLETRGYSVIPVFSGDDAIQLLKDEPKRFDIVLLDEQMPGKDGLTTLEEIKDLEPSLPVVMVTKSEEERVMEDAIGKKIDGYLTKPVNPSQILMICKKLLDSKQIISTQLKQKFVRSYSTNKAILANQLSANDWIKVYENLAKWDLELDNVDDEGMRQAQAGQKSDCNVMFSNLVMEYYGRWIKGDSSSPLLSVNVLEKLVYPQITSAQNVIMIVLSGMRLDQYLGIETILSSYFQVKRHHLYSILPSATPFSRNSLFAGMYPEEIAGKFSDVWTQEKYDDEQSANRYEETLLKDKLNQLGLSQEIAVWYKKLSQTADAQQLLNDINTSLPERYFGAVVVNFVELLKEIRTTSEFIKEIAPDESAYRSLTQSWFMRSTLLQVLKDLSRKDCTVVLTSDHGSVLCSRATEIYGAGTLGKSLRYCIGSDISSDERRVVLLPQPQHFKIAPPTEDASCILAKENFYFVLPDKFENYKDQYLNTFQDGGISMEEIIVPLGIFKPL